MFKNKILLITGGTGSFGNAVLDRFLDSEIKEIRIFSRDEKKQHDMRVVYNNPKIKFYIGDVRDYRSIDQAMFNVDYVFHAAALKQVPSCEFYPIEAVQTNVLGTENVLNVAISNNVNTCNVKLSLSVPPKLISNEYFLSCCLILILNKLPNKAKRGPSNVEQYSGTNLLYGSTLDRKL